MTNDRVVVSIRDHQKKRGEHCVDLSHRIDPDLLEVQLAELDLQQAEVIAARLINAGFIREGATHEQVLALVRREIEEFVPKEGSLSGAGFGS